MGRILVPSFYYYSTWIHLKSGLVPVFAVESLGVSGTYGDVGFLLPARLLILGW
jgi:hypothetical protein